MEEKIKKEELAKKLITSLIESNVTENDIKKFIRETKEYPFHGIAVDLPYLELTKKLLHGTGIRLIAPISYPLGGMTTETKIRQLQYAIEKGADEANVSLNYSAIKSGDFAKVLDDLKRVVEAAKSKIEIVAVLQSPILTNEEKVKVCNLIFDAGVRAIKVASGFGWNTRPEDVMLIRREFRDKFRIEASGGIRTTEQALEMFALGADLCHTSTWQKVLEGAK
jgi:deoxyribose-phosphate aldolase